MKVTVMQKHSAKSVDVPIRYKAIVSSLAQVASRARLFVLAPIAAAALVSSMPANALTITPTFSSAYDTTAQATINTALSFYQSMFIDPVSVTINFVSSGKGLGASTQSFYDVDYATYMTALRADATSADDATAMLHTPAGPNPVNGGSTVSLTRANALAVGLTVGDIPNGTNEWDAEIDLNLGEMNYTRIGINPVKYDLLNVAQHEINEVLGLVSALPDALTSGKDNFGKIAPVDLFRYTSAGARSFTAAGDDAYFSLNGTTTLARYNQDPTGDFGDFWSLGGQTYQIQDAFSSEGVFTTMNVETRMLDAVGFTLAPVPEPETYALMLAGLGLVGWAVKRRKA